MTTGPAQFFVSECIKRSVDMSYRDRFTFLRGMLLLAGDVEEVADLRSAFMALEAADDQLELIAGPQMRLSLNPEVQP